MQREQDAVQRYVGTTDAVWRAGPCAVVVRLGMALLLVGLLVARALPAEAGSPGSGAMHLEDTAWTAQVLPDLRATGLDVHAPGPAIQANLQFRNDGPGAVGPFTSFIVSLALYACPPERRLLETRSVSLVGFPAGKASNFFWSFNKPPGPWYVVGVVDAGNGIAEMNEGNNRRVVRSIDCGVLAPP